ncbi:hypothetical protein [Clostridium ganghwense]|uniref:Uncharacterized protein n=1 Tax=Clostridium ganghwense TaxID=312089 RepID=A0ABT4CTV4_9CLOT|nr:hypothetical protein [Clostridium ganghwense]MCY6371636.1 hypothetical protein [Clostridium ganghwense]
MANYASQPQDTKGSSINIPHFYQNEEANAVQYGETLQENAGQIPTLHSVAQTYEQNQKLKEIFNDNVLK